jgi:hypothetical protein
MADNVRYAFDARVDLDPEQAWEIYRDLPEPTARECANILQQRGFKVSYDTIARWARRGKWRERVERLRAVTGVGSPKDVAATLQIEAEWLTPDLLCGLQFRIAARMAERINQLPLDSPEDYAKLVDVLDKMDGIIHRQRGAHIGKRGNRSGNADPLQLDEFRAWRPDSDPKAG